MVLKRLKERTRPQHEALEGRVNIGGRCATIEGYRVLIERFYGFYAPAEAALVPLLGGEEGLELDDRRKTPLLRRDLLALGLGESEIDALPLCRDLPPLPGRPEALGCMYVMEGATLGGQYVRKSVSKELPEAAGALAFFSSYGDRVGSMWKAFGDALTARSDSPDAEDRIVDSAAATFDSFERWFAAAP
ncbi:biliverdin-producing heme oxygenase [Isosphaeraceae bacterium EP7]